MSNGVKFPFGAAETFNPAYAAVIAVTLNDMQSILTPATLTGAATINATIGAAVKAGARVNVFLTADGTGRAVTLGTGFTGTNTTVTANKTFNVEFLYDGVTYKKSSETTIN